MPSATARRAPTADPYADTDVVDARAPRFLQATVGAGAVAALLTGWWWLYGLLSLQLVAGLVLGRRWCLPCVAYFAFVQPRLGEGRVEDARPPAVRQQDRGHRPRPGLRRPPGRPGHGRDGPGGAGRGLALLAAATGLCVGCELYKLGGAAARGAPGRRRRPRPGRGRRPPPAGRPWSSSPTRCAATATSWRSAWPPGRSRSTPSTCPAGPTWPAATTWPWSRPPSGSPATAPCWSVSPSGAGPGQQVQVAVAVPGAVVLGHHHQLPSSSQYRRPARATGSSGSRRATPRPGPPAARGRSPRPAPGPAPRRRTCSTVRYRWPPGRSGPAQVGQPPAASPRAGCSPWRRRT